MSQKILFLNASLESVYDGIMIAFVYISSPAPATSQQHFKHHHHNPKHRLAAVHTIGLLLRPPPPSPPTKTQRHRPAHKRRAVSHPLPPPPRTLHWPLQETDSGERQFANRIRRAVMPGRSITRTGAGAAVRTPGTGRKSRAVRRASREVPGDARPRIRALFGVLN